MDPICDIAEDLAAGRRDTLDALFAQDGAQPPRLLWEPPPDVLAPPLPHLLRHWRGLCGASELPSPRAIDPAGLRFILGNLMLVDVEPRGTEPVPEFTYRLYGTRIAACSGRDMTGRSTRAFPGRMGVFFTATYEAARLRRRPLYTEHVPAGAANVTLWRRLLLPLAGDDGAVVRFLVGNVALSTVPCSPMMPQDTCAGEPGG